MNYIHIFECDGTQKSAVLEGTLTDADGGDTRLVVNYLNDAGEAMDRIDIVRPGSKYEVVYLPTLKDLMRFRARGWRIPEKK